VSSHQTQAGSVQSGRFSVVIPSYQQADYLPATLRSVADQAVGGMDVEIVIRDGGSTDGSVEIIRDFADSYPGVVNWKSGPDGGQTAAINDGLKAATGEWVCYLNSDDVLLPGALERVKEYFCNHPEVDLVYGRAEWMDAKGVILGDYAVGEWDYAGLVENCYLCQPATFWRRRLHELHGYFDESLRYCMDYEFWLRVGRTSQVVHLPVKLARARRHAGAKTFKDLVPMHREIVGMLARYGNGVAWHWVRALARMEAEEAVQGMPAVVRNALYYLQFARVLWGLRGRCRSPLAWKDFLAPKCQQTMRDEIWKSVESSPCCSGEQEQAGEQRGGG
jgi:glycosyltransferase involved in cell wall biosynthesis